MIVAITFAFIKMVKFDDTPFDMARPDLARQWSENNKTKPSEYTCNSGYRALWRCDNSAHPEYEAKIYQRAVKKNAKCPYCNGRKICESNTLGYLRPDLIIEWHEDNKKTIFDYTCSSHYKAKWKCPSVPSHPPYEATIYGRTNKFNGSGCPYCRGSIDFQTNSLAYKRPDLIKEWGTKNKLTPYDYACGSGRKVWWKCHLRPDLPEYMLAIIDRCRRSPECKYCQSVGVLRPHLIKEWSDRNKKTIYDYTIGSNFKVWWKCLENPIHPEYNRAIQIRSEVSLNQFDRGCPTCSSSRGERKVSDYLISIVCNFKKEKSFEDCRDKLKLRFDFYIEEYTLVRDDNVYTLEFFIEFHGPQHYEPIKMFGGDEGFRDRVKKDAIKRKYAQNRNIPLLEIKYTKSVIKIHKEINDFINKLIGDFSY